MIHFLQAVNESSADNTGRTVGACCPCPCCLAHLCHYLYQQMRNKIWVENNANASISNPG